MGLQPGFLYNEATSLPKVDAPGLARKGGENNQVNIDDSDANMDRLRNEEAEHGNSVESSEHYCCGRWFATERGLKIHQGKVCKRKMVQKRRVETRQSCGSVSQDENHSGTQAIFVPDVGAKKEKIKWPQANEKQQWNEFESSVLKLIKGSKKTTEERLEQLASTIYDEAERRFGIEETVGKKSVKEFGFSRRQKKLKEVRKEKKSLRQRWMNSLPEEKEGLKVLYEAVKKKHQNLMKTERRLKTKKERGKARKSFLANPYKYAKGLFAEKRSGRLQCSKEDLEKNIESTYSDHDRYSEVTAMPGLKKPSAPGIPFDMSDLRAKEVESFVKKARSKSSPGNDGVSYKVYKNCPRLRNILFLLLRDMWKKKKEASRWKIAEGIYIPKEENSSEIGQFRPISMLNIDGKIMNGILAKRVVDFIQKNGYVDESMQKAGIPGIPGCVEHSFAIWDAIQKAKTEKESLAVIWLDLANAYGSVPHKMLKEAMNFFWIPEEVQNMMMDYYDHFLMRFTTKDFTTNWQRLEIGIAAGCTISVIWFVLVMEMFLKSTDTEGIVINIPIRAFMDDLTVLTQNVETMEKVLQRLNQLITWARMKFKAKKSRSLVLVDGKPKEKHFLVGNEQVPTVKEKPVKSLGRLYSGNLTDRHQGVALHEEIEKNLEKIDNTKLSGKFKVWILQYGLYPRVMWPISMYEIAVSRMEKIEQRCNVYIRKWLGLPKMLNTSALYTKKGPLTLPLPSIVEEYKAAKVRTVMMLKESRDDAIKANPPSVKTGRKWQAEIETDNALEVLKHRDIVGAVQTGREGLGTHPFSPFCRCNAKERRDAVIQQVKKECADERYVKLVQCNQQGQCLQWEEFVVERKVKWADIWKWDVGKLSFLIKATYDTLPSPVNLMKWKIQTDDKCRCGATGTMRHILSHCPLALERYTWRHNEVLKVIVSSLSDKLEKFNEGVLPVREKSIPVFHKEGKYVLKRKTVKEIDTNWVGPWSIEADLSGNFVFPLLHTALRPDIVIYKEDVAILLELTVCWEDNFDAAENRKQDRYAELIERCIDAGYKAECHHIGIGCRGYVTKAFTSLLRRRFAFTSKEISCMVNQLQHTAERCSYWIWLKRDDNTWLE